MDWLIPWPCSLQALSFLVLCPPTWGSTLAHFQNYAAVSCLLLFTLWFCLSLWAYAIFIPLLFFQGLESENKHKCCVWPDVLQCHLNSAISLRWCAGFQWSGFSKQHLAVIRERNTLCKRRRILGYTVRSRSIAYLWFILSIAHRPASLYSCLPP